MAVGDMAVPLKPRKPGGSWPRAGLGVGLTSQGPVSAFLAVLSPRKAVVSNGECERDRRSSPLSACPLRAGWALGGAGRRPGLVISGASCFGAEEMPITQQRRAARGKRENDCPLPDGHGELPRWAGFWVILLKPWPEDTPGGAWESRALRHHRGEC